MEARNGLCDIVRLDTSANIRNLTIKHFAMRQCPSEGFAAMKDVSELGVHELAEANLYSLTPTECERMQIPVVISSLATTLSWNMGLEVRES